MASSSRPQVIILFAGRFPSEKAAGLFVDLNARSLVGEGAAVTVLAPRRLGRSVLQQVPYRVRYLPTIDLSGVPVLWNIANFISVWVFAKWALLWLVFKSSARDLIISNDAWPLLIATFVRKNTMYEVHDFAKHSWLHRTLFRRVRYVLVTNEWKRTELKKQFGLPDERLIFERNAVDPHVFGALSKKDARERLGLEDSARIVVYTGHLYEWKGADTLAAAAQHVQDTQFIFVGGAPADVGTFRADWAHVPNIRIVGHVDHNMVPIWQSAADVLVLPNSGKEEISVHYTSPMKLFEYMASGRPIVASDLPSIREVLGVNGYYARPDDTGSFAAAIREALSDDGVKPAAARREVEQYAWDTRAKRILQRIV